MMQEKLEVGRKAVMLAMRTCRLVQEEIIHKNRSISKTDRSPVTIADFLSQAIVCRILKTRFPEIPIVAEESSDILSDPRQADQVNRLLEVAGEIEEIGRIVTPENLLESIDLGTRSTSEYFWTLDPIDGTKGFLRGDQYAVALALIEEGHVQMGILGCPSLEIPSLPGRSGSVIHAVRGGGTWISSPDGDAVLPVSISKQTDTGKMRFVQSFESAHGNLTLQHQIARELKIGSEPVQMDSQVKYGVVASGEAEIYIRIPNPKTPDYKEKIWDHAAGSIVVEESGGTVTDIYGKSLDFGTGITLKNNTGIVVSVPAIHRDILDVIGKSEEIPGA